MSKNTPEKGGLATIDFMSFVKDADKVLKLVGRVFILLLVVWILWAFRTAYKNESYTFEAISVPAPLTEQGYTGEVMVQHILGHVQTILSQKYYDEQNPEAYRQIVSQPQLQFNAGSRAGYFDLQSLFHLGKVLLGKKDKTIRGSVVAQNDSLVLWLQMPDQTPERFVWAANQNTDALLQQVALWLIGQTTPQYLVYFYLDQGQFDNAERLLAAIDFKIGQMAVGKQQAHDRIQWFLSWTNLLLAQQKFEAALAKAEALQQAFPQDMAGYVQQINILTAQVVYLENQGTPPTVYRPLAEKAVHIAETMSQKALRSVYLNPTMSEGWACANWAYMLQKIGTDSAILLKKYQKAVKLLPNAAFAYNNWSYYYMDKKDYAAAEATIQKAVLADPNDGNAWDTYAEIMAITRDTSRFLMCLEKALQFQNPAEGISPELYARDQRWQPFQKYLPFQQLIRQYERKKRTPSVSPVF